MIEITPQIYTSIAKKILDQLVFSSDIFNGTVEYEDNEICAVFTGTLIIYRNRNKMNDSEIEKVTPVWWDFYTLSESKNGEEEINDFSWNSLKDYIF